MINFALLGLPLLCGVIASPMIAQKEEKVEVVSQVQPKLVAYSDNNYQITLSADEVNFQYENLYHCLNDNEYASLISLTYNAYDYVYLSVAEEAIYYKNSSLNSNIGLMTDYVTYDDSNLPAYNYYFFDDSQAMLLDNSLTITCTASSYSAIKTAIQQDIVDNTATMPSITDLFAPVSQAITAFVGALGQAFSSVTALFWTTGDNAGPTFLGLLVLIGVGVGILYGAYRIIKGLMHRI